MGSCGYQYRFHSVDSSEVATVEIPYIQGDSNALLHNALAYELSCSGHFRPVLSGGDLLLKVSLLEDSQDRIGFRYDRDNPSGTRNKNLLAVEDRRVIRAKVSCIQASSGAVLVDGYEVSSFADYDYTDPGSPQDLLFTAPSGGSESIIQFSLGQLDSYEGGHDAASSPVFKQLAQKIIEGLLSKE